MRKRTRKQQIDALLRTLENTRETESQQRLLNHVRSEIEQSPGLTSRDREELEAKVLVEAARLAWAQGEPDRRRAASTQALDAWRRIARTQPEYPSEDYAQASIGLLTALLKIAWIECCDDDIPHAKEHVREALRLYEDVNLTGDNNHEPEILFGYIEHAGVNTYLTAAQEALTNGYHMICVVLIGAVIYFARELRRIELGRAHQRLAEKAESWAADCARFALGSRFKAESAEPKWIVEVYCNLAADASRVAGDDAMTAEALTLHGRYLTSRAEYASAREKLTEALTAQHAARNKNGQDSSSYALIEAETRLLLASVCAELSDHSAAADLRDAALTDLRELPALFQGARSVQLQGLLAQFKNEFDRMTEAAKAAAARADTEFQETLLKQACRIAREIGDPVREAHSLIYLGELMQHHDRPAEAHQFMKDSLLLAIRSDDPFCIGLAVGSINILNGKPRQTRTYVPIRHESDEPARELAPMLRTAWAALSVSRLYVAKSGFWSAYQAATTLDDRRGIGEALCGLGAIAVMERKLDEARSFLHRALQTFRGIAQSSGMSPLLTMINRSALAEVLCWLSEVSRHEGAYETARRHAGEAQLTARSVGEEVVQIPKAPGRAAVPIRYDHMGEAMAVWESQAAGHNIDATIPWAELRSVHGLLALLRHLLRDPEYVEEWAQKAMLVAGSIGDVVGEVEAICWTTSSERGLREIFANGADELPREAANRMAYRFLYEGETVARSAVGRARFYYDQALAAFRALDDQAGQASALRGLGSISELLGRTDEAMELYQRAFEISYVDDDLTGQAHSLRRLARTLTGDTAVEMARQARRLSRKAGDPFGAAYALRLIGWKDPRATAFRTLESALRELQSLEKRFPEAAKKEEACTLRCLGSRALERGHFRRAYTYFVRANTVLGEFDLDRLGHIEAMEGKARALTSPVRKTRKVVQEAASLALSAVKLLEMIRGELFTATDRFALYRERRDLYLLALSLAAATDNGDMALEVMEVSRSDGLASLLRYAAVNAADVPGKFGELLQRVAELEARLPTKAAGTPGQRQPGALGESAPDGGSELKSLYQELAEYSPILRSAIDPMRMSISDLRTTTPKQYIALYDIDLKNRRCFTAWVEPAGGSHVQMRHLRPEIIDTLSAWAQRGEGTYDGKFEKFEELSDLLLPKKLRNQLRADTGDIPPRLLVVPAGVFWALPIAALPIDGRRLVECAEISYTPSLGVYGALTDGHTGSGALAYFHESLTGTEPELDALEEVFAPSFRTVNQAGLRDALRSGDAASLRMLVLAAHGDDSPGLAHGLQLDHGKLIAGELLSYRLPNLVVMGVCSSAKLEVEPGTEPLGLPTACLAAGAQSLIAALFPVDDTTTGDILAATYKYLAHGMSAAASLRLAQLDHLGSCQSRGGCPPSHWAGLVVFGSPAEVKTKPAPRTDQPQPGI